MVANREIGYRSTMSRRTALAGGAAAAVVFGVLGNPAVVDAVQEAETRAISQTVIGFASWDTVELDGESVGGVAIKVAVGIVGAALLCAVAGRARSRAAGLLGGWGAMTVAAAAAGALFEVYRVEVVDNGATPGVRYADLVVEAVNRGAAFGLWTGWFVGLAVALTLRTVPATARISEAGGDLGVAAEPTWAVPAAVAAGPTAAVVAEPPAPWWAPTGLAGKDVGVRPGPTAFPPGGLGYTAGRTGAPPVATVGPPAPPVAPDAEPGPPSTAAGAPDAGAGADATAVDGPVPDDPDATAALPADGTTNVADRTAPMPRPPD
jgi:hypothetical protein